MAEAIGLGERQRPDEDRVDQREDGGVGADGQRQRDDGREREAGVLAKRTKRKSQVVHVELHVKKGTVPFSFATVRKGDCPLFHSVRSATSGLTRAARRAGRPL